MIKLIEPVIEPENIFVEYTSEPFCNGNYGLFQPIVNKEVAFGFIYIHPKLTNKQKLKIATHEAIHIAYPQLNERQTETGAVIIADVIWKAGFRKT